MTGATVESMRHIIEKALDPLLEEANRCALIDFPSSANVGDNAIWLGETEYLRSQKMAPIYQCDRNSYAEKTLRRRLKDGIIFLHGGGNLGDVWEGSQELREEIILRFPSNRIVIMPQTIHFRERASLLRAQRIFNAHDALTVITRDKRSYEIAANEFECKTLLAPDMAFCMRGVERERAPSTAVLWLQRTDQESATYDIPRSDRVRVADWIELSHVRRTGLVMSGTTGLQMTARASKRAVRQGMRTFSTPFGKTFDTRARLRMNRGIRLLSEGRVVVTDRLHGHILSLMMGIPHVLLDNSYGKLRDFYDTWTRNESLARWASTPAEALSFAVELSGD